jgi:hypothetical protein
MVGGGLENRRRKEREKAKKKFISSNLSGHAFYLSMLITSFCCQVLSKYRQLLISFSESNPNSFLI